jgi:hypothetical protein
MSQIYRDAANVQVEPAGGLLHVVLRGDGQTGAASGPRLPADFLMTQAEAASLFSALERALRQDNTPTTYPVRAKFVAALVAVGLPAGFVVSILRPGAATDLVVPLAFSAWFALAFLLARRDRNMARPG